MMTAVWCLLGSSSNEWQVSTEGGRLFITSASDTQTNKQTNMENISASVLMKSSLTSDGAHSDNTEGREGDRGWEKRGGKQSFWT